MLGADGQYVPPPAVLHPREQPVFMPTSAPVHTLLAEGQHSLAGDVAFRETNQEFCTLVEAYQLFGETPTCLHSSRASHRHRPLHPRALGRFKCSFGRLETCAAAAAPKAACCWVGWVRPTLPSVTAWLPTPLACCRRAVLDALQRCKHLVGWEVRQCCDRSACPRAHNLLAAVHGCCPVHELLSLCVLHMP